MFQFILLFCKLQSLNRGNEFYEVLKNFITLSSSVKSTHFAVLDALVVTAPSNYNNDYALTISFYRSIKIHRWAYLYLFYFPHAHFLTSD